MINKTDYKTVLDQLTKWLENENEFYKNGIMTSISESMIRSIITEYD